MKFKWRPDKAAKNKRKHKVSFQEAATVFGDPLSVTVPDPDHSDDEERYIIVGWSSFGKLLMVSHTERSESIHLISARKLTPRERRAFGEGDYP